MKNKMSSKERVLTAFARQESDRVPVNYLCNPGVDLRLKNHFKLEAGDDEGLKKALNVDFRCVVAPYTGPVLHAPRPGVEVEAQWGIVRKKVEHASGYYMDFCEFPLMNADEETVARWPMPSPDDFDYSMMAEACQKQKEYAVFPDFAGNLSTATIMNSAGLFRGMEQVFMDLVLDDPAGLLLIDRFLAIELEVTYRLLEACKGGADFIWIGEDLGTQIAPMISMDIFQKHIKPRHQPFFDLAQSFDVPVMMHTCGSSSWAYDEYIKMGLQVVDTLQPEAKNMAPEYVKKRFGDHLAFHGCISTAGPVATGTVQETVDYCKRTLDIMMPGGGYCFAPTHALQDNSPTENVLAMYETAHTAGVY